MWEWFQRAGCPGDREGKSGEAMGKDWTERVAYGRLIKFPPPSSCLSLAPHHPCLSLAPHHPTLRAGRRAGPAACPHSRLDSCYVCFTPPRCRV
eukprot:scaffold59367_cov19-Tisochrysis_lutea.AAC.1